MELLSFVCRHSGLSSFLLSHRSFDACFLLLFLVGHRQSKVSRTTSFSRSWDAPVGHAEPRSSARSDGRRRFLFRKATTWTFTLLHWLKKMKTIAPSLYRVTNEKNARVMRLVWLKTSPSSIKTLASFQRKKNSCLNIFYTYIYIFGVKVRHKLFFFEHIAI